jgi:NLR family CARD domain-containing protein 3
MKIVKKSREFNEAIKLNEYKIGNDYANVFAKTFKKTKQKILYLNMKNNKLEDDGAKAIINALTEHILEIDISWNQKIGFSAYSWLGQRANSIFFRLTKLTLDHNNISLKSLEALWEGLAYSTSLKILNLNHNNLENEHAFVLADLLRDSSLKMLFIAWNRIRDKGAERIFQQLENNLFLQVFDGSFNSFSSGIISNNRNTKKIKNKIAPNEEIYTSVNWAKQMSQMFENNFTLIHMDLSHNNFSDDDWKEISKGLNKNRSVLGLHMSGNSRDTNALGFIDRIPNADPGVAHIHTRIHESLETGVLSEKRQEFKASSNCWICEGWKQVKFTFVPRTSTEDIIDEFTPVYIHLDWDDYEPDLMVRDFETGIHSVIRMVPPREIKYFYTFGDHHIRIAKDQPVMNNFSTYEMDIHNEVNINIPKMNFINNFYSTKSLITEEFLNKMSVKPRPDPKNPPIRVRPKTPWDFNKSIFAAYKQDTPELLDNCFETDWENSRIPKIVKGDGEEEVKEFLRSQYRSIRECYKYYAGIIPSNQVFCISKTMFNEIINGIQPSIIDSNLSIAAIDLEFITTVSGFKGGKLNPNRDLIRFQFLEIFVRLAVHKYFRTKIWKSKCEAIQKFFNEDIGVFLSKFRSYEWREHKYFCEEVEFILKEYSEELEELFKMYSGRYTMPSQPKFVSLEEFGEMIANSGVLSLNLANKDIGKYYNLSLETEIDELENEKHMQMFTLEFYEAIARVAEKIQFTDEKLGPESTTNLISQIGGNLSSRKNTEANEQLKEKDQIFIQVQKDIPQSESNSSNSSDNILNEATEDEFMKQSTIVKGKDFYFPLHHELQNSDESAYSLGDGDKLYLKLEHLIKILIRNWFKKKMKKMSNKLNHQLSKKTNIFLIDEDTPRMSQQGTPRKHLSNSVYEFKRAFTKNLPSKNAISTLQPLSPSERGSAT